MNNYCCYYEKVTKIAKVIEPQKEMQNFLNFFLEMLVYSCCCCCYYYCCCCCFDVVVDVVVIVIICYYC